MHAQYSQSPTWFFILGPITLLMILVIIAVFVALFWHERTRPIGWGLLGVLGLSAVLFTLVAPVHTTMERLEVEWAYPPPLVDVTTVVPEIELEQAAQDMNATAPVAEVVEKLSEDGDVGERDKDLAAKEDVKIESPKAVTKEEATLPEWVTQIPSTVGGVYRKVVDSGPWSEVSDCQSKLDYEVYEAIQERLQNLASEELQQVVSVTPSLEYLGIPKSWIDQNIVCSDPAPFVQTTHSSVGPMKILYAQLEFDGNDQEFLRQKYIDYIRRDRIAAVATGGVFVLGGLGMLFGLLKIDTWTKGYYTKRLFLGVPAAIIGVGALLALMIS